MLYEILQDEISFLIGMKENNSHQIAYAFRKINTKRISKTYESKAERKRELCRIRLLRA